MKISKLIEQMLATRTDLRQSSQNSYRVETRRFGDLLERDALTLTAVEMERWAGDSQKRRRAVRSLKAVLNWSVRHGHLAVNPIAACKGPRIVTRTHQPGIHRALELPALFERARDKAFVTFLLDTGIRVREAIALTWDRVDLDERIVTVDRSVDARGRYQGLKTRGAEREISISSPTASLLRELLPTISHGVPVFRSSEGYRLHLNNWYHRVWMPTLRAAGIKLRVHDLRHACATLLLERGVPIAAVQQRLGHADMQTTARFYTRRSRILSQGAASAMDAILGGSN